MNNDSDLDLTRFVRALSHARIWIMGAAMFGLLLGALLGFRSRGAAATVSFQPNHKKLVESDFIVGLDTDSMLQLTASDLASESFLIKLESKVGNTVAVVPKFSTGSGNIQVHIDADSKKVAASAATVVIAEAQARYATEFSRPAGESLTRLNGLIVAAEKRRADIQERLQQTSPGPLADGLILDLEQQSTQVSKVQASASTLATIVKNAPSELQATSIEISKTHKIILYPLGLALVAALLCAGWIVARAAFDRKVRTRRDLERLGIHSLLGSLPVSHDVTDAAIVGSAISSTSADKFSHLAPVVSTPQANGAVAAIAQAVDGDGRPNSVVVLPGLDIDPVAITSAESADLTTLIVEWGAVRAETLVQRVNQLSAAGAKQVCVVLVGVPDRLRADYER